MRRYIKIFGVIVVVGLIIFYAAAKFMLWFALQPEVEKDVKYMTSYEYMTREYPHIRPWLDSLSQTGVLRDTTILGQDEERLHALYVPAQQPTSKTAVIVHGYTDNAIRMMMIGYMYHHDLGYNILLPDLHYHGASEGEAIRMGWLDRLDVMRWMEIANSVFGGNTQMVVHGISMGAATTMMVAGEAQPNFVKCFVEDCGYTSVWDQFQKELKEQFHLPSFPLLNMATALCRWRYGWGFREASALKQVEKASLPMMFIHGDADDYVPTWMVHPLYEAKSGEKELWIVPGAEHAASYRENKEEYTRRVGEFVGRYIK